jgi:hypothetical protein
MQKNNVKEVFKMIDKNVIKYIPKKLQPHVTHCDRFNRYPNGYTYNVIFDYDVDTSIFADSVAGLRWACKEVLNGERGVIYG